MALNGGWDVALGRCLGVLSGWSGRATCCGLKSTLRGGLAFGVGVGKAVRRGQPAACPAVTPGRGFRSPEKVNFTTALQGPSTGHAARRGRLRGGAANIAEARGRVRGGRANIAEAWGRLRDGRAKIAEAQGRLRGGRAKIAEGRGRLRDGRAKIAEAQGRVRGGAANIAEAWGRLRDGRANIAEAQGRVRGGAANITVGWSRLRGAPAMIAAGLGRLRWSSCSVQVRWGRLRRCACSVQVRWRRLRRCACSVQVRWGRLRWSACSVQVRWGILRWSACSVQVRWRRLRWSSCSVRVRWRRLRWSACSVQVKWGRLRWSACSVQVRWRRLGCCICRATSGHFVVGKPFRFSVEEGPGRTADGGARISESAAGSCVTATMKRRSIAGSVPWISTAWRGGPGVDQPTDLAAGSAAFAQASYPESGPRSGVSWILDGASGVGMPGANRLLPKWISVRLSGCFRKPNLSGGQGNPSAGVSTRLNPLTQGRWRLTLHPKGHSAISVKSDMRM